MSDYGTHPTQYGNLNNETLYSMYRESVYSKLSENEKLDLLQETVNRDALERGEIGSPKVKFADMPSNVSGNASDGVISVNRDMAVNGVQTMEYQGHIIRHSIDDYNIQSLNTVLHENVHCFQDQIIDGTISIDDKQITSEYQANSFTASAVLQNHSYCLGSQYLTGETSGGYYMYYFQATERDAYWSSEKGTEEIIRSLTEKYGIEPSFVAYAKSLAATGYQVREREAIQMFQNPDFVKDLNQTLQNHYFGTSKPVNLETEKAVKAEMVETMRTMQQQIINGNKPTIKEDTKMNFDYKPVSLEEYNQSLRDSVNAYYTHAMNDPSMSKEDVLKSTDEMAEKYIEAVEEFQEVQNEQIQDFTVENNTEAVQATAEVETGNVIGTGLDNGEENDICEGTGEESSADNDGLDDGEGCDGGMDA